MFQIAAYTTFLALLLSATQITQAGTLPSDTAILDELVARDSSILAKRDGRCYPRSEATPGNVGGAVDCNNFLLGLGTTACTVSRGGTIMCHSGRTIVKGFGVGNDNTASSYCRDVATAVAWVLNNCPACPGNDCDIAGYQYAGGNGNLLVKVSGFISRRKNVRLPPGPPPLPFIGNSLDVPKSMSAKEYDRLCQTYGDIVHLDALGRHIIILGSQEAIFEILEKRAAKYSDRPPSAMSDLLGYGLLNYGDQWRKQRRRYYRFLGPTAVSRYYPLLENQTQRLLQHLLKQPRDFSEQIRFIIGATITKLAYGLDVDTPYDEYLSLTQEGNDIFVEAFVPGRYLVESFPILKHIPRWFPGATFRRQAAEWRETYVHVLNKPFEAGMTNVHRGRDNLSMMAGMIVPETLETNVDEETAKATLASIHLGGADTTQSIIRLFFLAMAKYTEIQKKAQAEFDRVIGSERLPQISDQKSLPYVEAVVMECFQWKPIVPFAFPHVGTADDEYKGYFIPKGSLVIGNSWRLSRDQSHYADPERFAPERFLNEEGQLNPDVLDPRTFAFGYGRRVCPGRHLGEASVFVTIASILHTFSIQPPVNEKGVALPLDVKCVEGFLSYPELFSCRISVRSSAAQALIVANGSAEGN
ncbi:cytochrome P450 [Fomes fomentarius]|nr:cytochrome P450 [Fomes fomentarius]